MWSSVPFSQQPDGLVLRYRRWSSRRGAREPHPRRWVRGAGLWVLSYGCGVMGAGHPWLNPSVSSIRRRYPKPAAVAAAGLVLAA